MIKYTVEVGDEGTRIWTFNSQLHREDGPACEYANGDKEWWLHDQRHREDGPACEYADGSKIWYQYGQEYTEQEFLNLTRPVVIAAVAELERALGYRIRVVKG